MRKDKNFDADSSSHSHHRHHANKKSDTRISFGSVFMWVLNVALIGAGVLALSNWTSVNWMTGSYGWATLLEIMALLLLLFLVLTGVCLLGWGSRVESSFIHLEDSPQMLYLFALAMPFLVASFFGALSLLSLLHLPATNLFVASHAEAVWQQASSYCNDPNDCVSVQAFTYHICSLPSFDCPWLNRELVKGSNPPHYTFTPKLPDCEMGEIPRDTNTCYTSEDPRIAFRRELSNTFDAMIPPDGPSRQTNTLSAADIYQGVQVSLAPYRQRFGWSVFAITCICVVQFGYYWLRYMSHQRTNKKSIHSDKEGMPL